VIQISGLFINLNEGEPHSKEEHRDVVKESCDDEDRQGAESVDKHGDIGRVHFGNPSKSIIKELKLHRKGVLRFQVVIPNVGVHFVAQHQTCREKE
jgi:hypothetical protein